MKIYQIVENYQNVKHAGSKAKNDAVEILSNFGAEKVHVEIATREMSILSKIKRQIKFINEWKKVYNSIDNNSILIIQNPFTIRQVGRFSTLMKLKQKKNVKIVSLVHDVEVLRFDTEKTRNEFKETLAIADKLIVHNESMIEWFKKQGVEASKLINLEIFDYLNEKSSDEIVNYSNKVTIAGNLELEKAPYVYELHKVLDVNFDLLGINYINDKKSDNINYVGAFAPEEVPYKLNSGFGLVWDGPSIETCTGVTGNYLRYNNPHKLSLYISSLLPVVVWSEAALADFVEKNNIGITVSSLYELNSKLAAITETQYSEMVNNTKIIKERLQEGYYLTKAVRSAVNQLKNNE